MGECIFNLGKNEFNLRTDFTDNRYTHNEKQTAFLPHIQSIKMYSILLLFFFGMCMIFFVN